MVLLVFLFSGCVGPNVNTTPVYPVRRAAPDWLYAGTGSNRSIPKARYLGKFKITYYWVVEEADYPKTRTTPLYTVNGKLLGKFCPSFVKELKTESAAHLRDGRCISYLKKQNRVMIVDRFLGYGGYTLTELKSVAVDPKVIPLGSRLFIPQFERVKLNEKELNGIFYAHDIGSGVKGNHLDIFLGKKDYMKLLASAGIKSSGVVDVYLLE